MKVGDGGRGVVLFEVGLTPTCGGTPPPAIVEAICADVVGVEESVLR